MGWIRTRRPSPAVAVAAVALVAALAGTAIAGPAATTSALTKKKVRKIVAKQVNELAPGLSVGHAKSSDTAVSAATATSATQAENATNAAHAESATNAVSAESAQPAAFAHVLADGTLDAANSKNVGGVARESEGTYCFTGIPFTPRGGNATVDGNLAQDQYAQIGINSCSSNEQAFVLTVGSDGALDDAPFYVVFYK